MDNRKEEAEYYPGGADGVRPTPKPDEKPCDGLKVRTNTIPDLRSAIKEVARILGATIVSVWAICAMANITVTKQGLNDFELDEDPQVVTDVTADFGEYATTNDVAAAVAAAVEPKADATRAGYNDYLLRAPDATEDLLSHTSPTEWQTLNPMHFLGIPTYWLNLMDVSESYVRDRWGNVIRTNYMYTWEFAYSSPNLNPIVSDFCVTNTTSSKMAFRIPVWASEEDESPYYYDFVATNIVETSGVAYEADIADATNDVAQAARDAYKPKQAAKTSPDAATIEAYQFIDTISQDTDGVITATKKIMRKATTSAPGMVQLNDNTNSTRTDHAATANAVRKAYERANAACIELENKADTADVYTKSQVDAALAAAATNLVETVIKESTYNLTWDAGAGIMWRKVARNGAFYEQCYTNVNIIVEGNQ